MKEFPVLGADPFRMDIGPGRYVLLFAVALLLFAASDMALAADPFADTSLAKGLGSLVEALNGAIARSLAVIAVIGSGIAALTGRMEWSRAVVVVLGVGVIFSASAMINQLFPVASAVAPK